MSIDIHDERRIRCRMLGHEVDFVYCRQTTGASPCRKILDCWFETFDVEDFMGQHYSPEQIRRLLEPPKPKITSIVELIQQAQKSSEDQQQE